MVRKFSTIQKKSLEAAASRGNAERNSISLTDNREHSVQLEANNTGLPDSLKSGIEHLSGHSLNDVKVHYNSSQPAQLNAHAYAQGNQIHIGPGQEKHLPHEAWHVVQQKEGRVQPTMQMKGKVNINDDVSLEKEADVMGAKAMQLVSKTTSTSETGTETVMHKVMASPVAQLTTKITHTAGLVPFAGRNYIVGKKMVANLDPNQAVKGSATTAENYDWMKGLNVFYPAVSIVRGHLLNHDLGGFGVPENLYPISSIANSDHSHNVEQEVKGALTNSKKTGKEILYRVEVKEHGAKQSPYEKADFECNWTDENGKSHSHVVRSQFGIDRGWSGKSSKGKTSPAAWRHGARRGAENMGDYMKAGHIGITYEGFRPEELAGLKAQTTGSKGIDVQQDWTETLAMLRHELDELGPIANTDESKLLLANGIKYYTSIKKHIDDNSSKGTLGQLVAPEIMPNIMAIRKTRLYLQDGWDVESNLADAPEEIDLGASMDTD
jgi:hypothetical protein